MDFTEAIKLTGKDATKCGVRRFLNTLDESTQQQVTDALEHYDRMRVWKASQMLGFKGSYSIWTRHFQGNCGCK